MQNHECKICRGKTSTYIDGLFDERYGYPKKFSVLKCQNCGFMQTFPEMKESDLSDLYTNYYPRQNLDANKIKTAARFTPSFIWRARVWLKGQSNTCHFHILPSKKVLDVGCGDGTSLLEIQTLGAKAFGTEEDRNVAVVAKALKLNIFIGGLDDSNFRDNYFDFVTASQVIEHTPSPKSFLISLSRKVRNDGRVILSFPNPRSLNFKLFGRRWINWHIPFHQNFFSKKSFRILANDAGLEIVKWKTVTPNDWTILQAIALASKTKPGNAKAVWGVEGSLSKSSLSSIFLRFIKPIVLFFLMVPITFVNRFTDFIGAGDSIIVTLKKEIF